MSYRGLDDVCAVCQRPVGDHTLREYRACSGNVEHLPYEDQPHDSAAAAGAAMLRKRLELNDSVIVADHVVARALTFATGGPTLAPVLGGIMLELALGTPGRPPTTVGEALYIGDADVLRKFGRLIRDTANGAANAIERHR